MTPDFFDFEGLCAQCRVPDPERFAALMNDIYHALLEVNSVTNLTRITEEKEFWIKHVADSLYIAKAVDPQWFTDNTQWCDFGCGGGFPTLVLAAAYPDITMTGIDSIGKKTAFVADCAQRFKLRNLHVMTGRGRELERQSSMQNRFDVLTARAVATPERVLLEAGKMVKRGGSIVLYQTPEQIRNDFFANNLQEKLPQYRWSLSLPMTLPMDAGERQFLLAERR